MGVLIKTPHQNIKISAHYHQRSDLIASSLIQPAFASYAFWAGEVDGSMVDVYDDGRWKKRFMGKFRLCP
jgi:hypothetical protein